MARFGTTPKSDPLAVRLSTDVLEALKRVAVTEERSLAWCIDQILRQHFERVGELEPKPRQPSKVVAS